MQSYTNPPVRSITRRTLSPDDLLMFRGFGITPELAVSRVERIRHEEAYSYGFRFGQNGSRLDGLLYKYVDPETGHQVASRLRRDEPERDANGRLQNKYLT